MIEQNHLFVVALEALTAARKHPNVHTTADQIWEVFTEELANRGVVIADDEAMISESSGWHSASVQFISLFLGETFPGGSAIHVVYTEITNRNDYVVYEDITLAGVS